MTDLRRQIAQLLGIQFSNFLIASNAGNCELNTSNGRVGIPDDNQQVVVTNDFVLEGSGVIAWVTNVTNSQTCVQGTECSDGEFTINLTNPSSGTAWIEFIILRPNPAARMDIVTGEGSEEVDAFDIAAEVCFIEGRLEYARNSDCPGPFGLAGNSERQGGVEVAFQVMDGPNTFQVLTSGAVISQSTIQAVGGFIDGP